MEAKLPADWPLMVTRPGSPPNWRMLSRTQASAITCAPASITYRVCWRGVRPRLVPHTRVAGDILRAEREEAEGPESVSASSRVSALMCYLVCLRMRT